MCDQQRLRPACAYAQSDQSLCLSLEYPMTVKLLTDYHLKFLSLTEFLKAAQARPSPHSPKCHIVRNLMNWLKFNLYFPKYQTLDTGNLSLTLSIYAYERYLLSMSMDISVYFLSRGTIQMKGN